MREGFAIATGDDPDDPGRRPDRAAGGTAEVLPRSRSGDGEFVNGTRLVYPMEEEAMRFVNMIGNKFFALTFSLLLGQPLQGHAVRHQGARPRNLRGSWRGTAPTSATSIRSATSTCSSAPNASACRSSSCRSATASARTGDEHPALAPRLAAAAHDAVRRPAGQVHLMGVGRRFSRATKTGVAPLAD